MASVHHINPSANMRPQPIAVPHTLNEAGAEVCLIVAKNRKAYTEMIAAGSVPRCVRKVLDVAKLRAQFHTFESRRKLVNSYDLFVCDRRVAALMPSLLGREFFKKKKTPVPIKVTGGAAGPEIARAASATYVRLRIGNATTVKAAKLSWPQPHIVDNVLAVAQGIAELTNLGKTEKGPWHNI
jgi:ribosome biogenesis protein UTP30